MRRYWRVCVLTGVHFAGISGVLLGVGSLKVIQKNKIIVDQLIEVTMIVDYNYYTNPDLAKLTQRLVITSIIL